MKRLKISDETIAAFLDGNATVAETAAVLDAARNDARLREMLALAIEDAPGKGLHPEYAFVAKGATDNLCAIRCEQYVLQKFGITRSEDQLTEIARKIGSLQDDGTPMERLGDLCAHEGLAVEKLTDAYLKDIIDAIAAGKEVIVAVDGGELYGAFLEEQIEDEYIGQIPDHSVVVLSCNDGCSRSGRCPICR